MLKITCCIFPTVYSVATFVMIKQNRKQQNPIRKLFSLILLVLEDKQVLFFHHSKTIWGGGWGVYLEKGKKHVGDFCRDSERILWVLLRHSESYASSFE